ncbi:MAG: hypothetical protein E7616_06345 [Ruminococcaceae bacterium]|nr:hypothetical protein [Oscillospiraceae bacterium]
MSREKQRNKELSFANAEGRLSLFLDNRTPKELLLAIAALGVKPIMLPLYRLLPKPVSAHPDMLLYDLGGKLLVYQDYYTENEKLFVGMPVVVTNYSAENRYPGDIGMDALSVGKFLFCLPQYTCPEILAGRTVVPVKQGYAACSALKVSEDAIVTSDSSIALAAEKKGIAVLRIRPGFIELPGYDYGFIGGTAFCLGDTLYFAGDLSMHPDGDAIADFCKNRGVTAKSLLVGKKLMDLGFLKYNEKAM